MEGRLAGYELCFLETERVWQSAHGNRLFYILTRGVIEGPELLGELTEREEEVYNEIMDWLLQQPPRAMGGIEMRMEKIREYQARQLERKQAWLNSLPPEERLKGLKPEERLKGLKPEERLRGLSPEDVVRRFPADRLAQALRPEERLKGLKPEELLSGLGAEEREALLKLLKEGL